MSQLKTQINDLVSAFLQKKTPEEIDVVARAVTATAGVQTLKNILPASLMAKVSEVKESVDNGDNSVATTLTSYYTNNTDLSPGEVENSISTFIDTGEVPDFIDDDFAAKNPGVELTFQAGGEFASYLDEIESGLFAQLQSLWDESEYGITDDSEDEPLDARHGGDDLGPGADDEYDDSLDTF